MKNEQKNKILKVCITATFVMLICEVVFSVPQVLDFFRKLILNGGAWFWVILWAIMFLQTTILNIPAYVILSACTSIGIKTLSIKYIAIVLSAYVCGCILAYWLGRWFGKKAVKWCAGSEEDYNKWCEALNKKGKWWYFASVIFPLFPDDLLCIIAGSVNFDFAFYTFANLVGRGVGLVTMLLFLKCVGSVGGSFPFMLCVWCVALLVEIVMLFFWRKEK